MRFLPTYEWKRMVEGILQEGLFTWKNL